MEDSDIVSPLALVHFSGRTTPDAISRRSRGVKSRSDLADAHILPPLSFTHTLAGLASTYSHPSDAMPREPSPTAMSVEEAITIPSLEDTNPMANNTTSVEDAQPVAESQAGSDDEKKPWPPAGCRQEFRCRYAKNNGPELILWDSQLQPLEMKCSHLACRCDRTLFAVRHPCYTIWSVFFDSQILYWTMFFLILGSVGISFWFQLFPGRQDPCGATPLGAFKRSWNRSFALDAVKVAYLGMINYAYWLYVGDQSSDSVSSILHLAILSVTFDPYLQGGWAALSAWRDSCVCTL